MQLEAIDFSEKISERDIFMHIRYYYTMSNIAMGLMETNKKEAMDIYKEIRKNLSVEYKEYQKVRNYNFIRKNKLYAQYVDNLTNAYIKPTSGTSYEMLYSNLYDVHDYIATGFRDFLEIDESVMLDLSKIDIYMGKRCKLITKDYLVYEGLLDLRLANNSDTQIESISIFDFEKWNQIFMDNIKAIKIVEQ